MRTVRGHRCLREFRGHTLTSYFINVSVTSPKAEFENLTAGLTPGAPPWTTCANSDIQTAVSWVSVMGGGQGSSGSQRGRVGVACTDKRGLDQSLLPIPAEDAKSPS